MQHLNQDLEIIKPSHQKITMSTKARSNSKSAVKLPEQQKRWNHSPNIGFYSTAKHLPKKNDCDESRMVIEFKGKPDSKKQFRRLKQRQA